MPDELSTNRPLAVARGLRLFATPRGQPRARRGTDVVLFVASLLGVVLAVVAFPPSSTEESLARLLATLPGWLEPMWAFFTDLIWLVAVVLVLAALVRRRILVVVQALAALLLAALVALVAARLALGSWPDVSSALLGRSDATRFPNVRVAEAAAVLATISPHLIKPARTFGRWIVLLGVISAAIVGGATPVGTVAAVLIALVAAAGVRLASGTSAGRPTLDAVEADLAELGVRALQLEEGERQVAGVFHVRGVDHEGRRLLVKVYGRDAYDTQLVAKLWRRIWYRGTGPAVRLSRLHAAEHEAFVTLLSRSVGLATHDVVTAGATIDDDALLVLAGDVRPLSALGPDELDDATLRRAWAALALLDRLGIAHQQIDPSTTAASPNEVGFVDFGGAAVAAGAHQRTADRAQLLMTTVALAGSDRALRAAVGALGRDAVASLLPYLQTAVAGPSLRRALKAGGVDVDELRAQAAEAIGVEPPEVVKLRRVTVWSVAQLGLLLLATSTILSAAGDVDWEQVRTAFENASWAWIGLAVVVAQLPRVTQALATLGSVPAPLPLGPVYALQLATGYMNVALPSNLARLAVNIRFFQRQGLSGPTAVASGAIDSFASTIVQAVLLVLLLVFSESTLALDLPLPSGATRNLLWILVGVTIATALVLVLLRRLRRAIVEQVRRFWPDVRRALTALRASHKLALLLLGNLASEVLFATALGVCARGFGSDLPLAELLVINISVSLLASFIPVPGGIGVAEFGLVLGLSSAGMTAEAALAAVLLYRLATFYLPPVWGFLALRWLQRNRYL
ncbi:MAG TPA: lysylphosphatidylglycerol synthase transmembrane domain-containing protein [Gaiellaceae bacterium]|nr:lysylphosphatidylglycerol synthase transmembrane domain-containing protein [Gaiellaceae bacterium]